MPSVPRSNAELWSMLNPAQRVHWLVRAHADPGHAGKDWNNLPLRANISSPQMLMCR